MVRAFISSFMILMDIRSYRRSIKFWEKEREQAMKRHDFCCDSIHAYQGKLQNAQDKQRGLE